MEVEVCIMVQIKKAMVVVVGVNFRVGFALASFG